MSAISLNRLRLFASYLKPARYSASYGTNPTITFSKSNPLIDEKVQIIVKGLSKHQKVTLHSFLKESGKYFAAWGHYIANENGDIDTFKHHSHGGTFEGQEPMGLFWSMRSEDPKKPKRIMKSDVMTPFNVRLNVCDGFVPFEKVPWSEEVPCLNYNNIHRHYTLPGVQRIPVKENGLYGTLFLPPGKGPFPAIIDIFGLTGGVLELRSPLFASHGFATFSLGYVNFEDLPKDDQGLDFNYFLRAFDWLAAHPAVDENAMGAISSCVGGGYIGLIAMKRPSLKCFVSLNNLYMPFGQDQEIEGECIVATQFKLDRLTSTSDGIVVRTIIWDNDELTFLPIWRHGVKMLQIHSLDDQCINPIVGKKYRERVPPEFQQNITSLEYPGAGHLLEPPFLPMSRSSYNQIYRKYLLWGGQAKYHADAQEDSWPKILDFLHTHLKI